MKRQRKRRMVRVKTAFMATPQERWQATIDAWSTAEAKAHDTFITAMDKAMRAWNQWHNVQAAAARAMARIENERNWSLKDEIKDQSSKLLAAAPWPTKKGEQP